MTKHVGLYIIRVLLYLPRCMYVHTHIYIYIDIYEDMYIPYITSHVQCKDPGV